MSNSDYAPRSLVVFLVRLVVILIGIIAILIGKVAYAEPRRINVQPVVVNLSGDIDMTNVRKIYTDAAALLGPTLIVHFEEPIEVFAYCPIGESKSITENWHDALCPGLAAPGRLVMVLDPRNYTIGTIRGTCVLKRECPTIVVQFDPRDPVSAVIATAHEIGHGGGAPHDPSCSLMSSRALVCGKRGVRLSSRSKAQIRACFRRKGTIK